ncbi:NADH dehydrogenase [ubiquinone] 1 beta subcomplex subunit 3-A-like [Juglans microcarpa x Juglans regia]|uniref:NADH dehydrogenase [ubiquinone] 1 beta subcomplex subunit 3-A-like n=1 Tax=Juglans microcarpa x Juglans regia TaxID=2249226 RepID=UPI001B7DDF88|nr:NADH dehydrogenase [ubiquinone] 1 beta subcomplex subunit 3-A-like [Juglans microcarpa x Juglans regia]
MANKALRPTGEFFRRRDQWRNHPMLTNQLRHATPGLGIALVAFGIYIVGEQVYNSLHAPSSSHSHHSSPTVSSASH